VSRAKLDTLDGFVPPVPTPLLKRVFIGRIVFGGGRGNQAQAKPYRGRVIAASDYKSEFAQKQDIDFRFWVA
jgi:hypothetical protein